MELDPNVYRAAAEIIRTHAWAPGEAEIIAGIILPKNGHCAVTALQTVLRGKSWSHSTPYFEALSERIPDMEGSFSVASSIIAWNDSPGRTKEQVIALFEQVAQSLEQSQRPVLNADLELPDLLETIVGAIPS